MGANTEAYCPRVSTWQVLGTIEANHAIIAAEGKATGRCGKAVRRVNAQVRSTQLRAERCESRAAVRCRSSLLRGWKYSSAGGGRASPAQDTRVMQMLQTLMSVTVLVLGTVIVMVTWLTRLDSA